MENIKLQIMLSNKIRYAKCKKICNALFHMQIDKDVKRYCKLLIYSLPDEDVNKLYGSTALKHFIDSDFKSVGEPKI